MEKSVAFEVGTAAAISTLARVPSSAVGVVWGTWVDSQAIQRGVPHEH